MIPRRKGRQHSGGDAYIQIFYKKKLHEIKNILVHSATAIKGTNSCKVDATFCRSCLLNPTDILGNKNKGKYFLMHITIKYPYEVLTCRGSKVVVTIPSHSFV